MPNTKTNAWHAHQQIVHDYQDSGLPWPATARQIASFAIETGLWRPQHSLLVGQCAEELSRAMREEYFIDPQGRSVRAKHAVRTKKDGHQVSLWGDWRTAPREFMQAAFAQRRQQIVGDCHRLKIDVDSYNENRSPEQPIQMVFDFSDDLAELKAFDEAS